MIWRGAEDICWGHLFIVPAKEDQLLPHHSTARPEREVKYRVCVLHDRSRPYAELCPNSSKQLESEKRVTSLLQG